MRWMMLAAALAGVAAAAPAAGRTIVVERSIDALQADMAAGRTTAERLVRAYRARIAAIDRRGPTLRSMIALNPDAEAQARALDRERRAGRVRGPLHGIPLVIKDNIETADPIATTAGSLALRGNVTGRDAPVVARLRAAGAVILGKANLSEWANIRGSRSVSGWSAVGGLVRNPHALDRSACGSSSGTAAAVAASLAAAGVGTETDGSVTCPASVTGIVGLKPTVGLVSRTRVIPISHSQDTPGPMARSVRDAALLLAAMAGPDAADPATADARADDFAAGLDGASLAGVRVAVLRPDMGLALAARFDAALAVLRAAGAILVPVERPPTPGLGDDETMVLRTELKAGLDAYLAITPPAVTTRTLDAVIAFNRTHAAAELPFFGQDTFEKAAATAGLDDSAYRAALARSRAAARGAIDAMLAAAGARLLVTPSTAPAWKYDTVDGDHAGGPSASQLPAVAGYPNLSVPMGVVRGMPVGLAFIAARGEDRAVLAAGHAFDQRAKARVAPAYRATLDEGAGLEGAVTR